MTAVVEHLSNLIRIASNSAVSNRPVVEYAAEVLHSVGWTTRALPYRDPQQIEKVNLIAAPPGQNISAHDADLVLMCHSDTVPIAPEWERALDPYVAEEKLHGCGACDVKGFLACILAAVSAEGQFIDGLRIVLSADEEIGCIGAAHLLADHALHPRRMIIGEPTQLHPARAGKGYCLAEATVSGKEAHSAHPAQGVSAIYHAARLITAIEKFAATLAQEQNSFFDPPYTTINIGIVQGGTAKNIVAGSCRFQLEWRPIPGELPSAVLDSVTAIIAELRRGDPALHAEIHPVRQQSGFETPAASPLVRGIERLSGRAATSIPFGSEASLFGPIVEEVVVFGPGDMRTAHSSRECVPLAELDAAVSILRAMIRPA
ncbi:MAG TPA: acetylornithine deacetylase [Acidobacteriaceae bacterium]|nr:acetylornithine deacetylase [Acidobacteriaceae bacterium]